MDYEFIDDILESGLIVPELAVRSGRRRSGSGSTTYTYPFRIDPQMLEVIARTTGNEELLYRLVFQAYRCGIAPIGDFYNDDSYITITREHGIRYIRSRWLQLEKEHRKIYNYITNEFEVVQDRDDEWHNLWYKRHRLRTTWMSALYKQFYRVDEANDLYIELSFSSNLSVRLHIDEWRNAPTTMNGWRINPFIEDESVRTPVPFPSMYLNTISTYLYTRGMYDTNDNVEWR